MRIERRTFLTGAGAAYWALSVPLRALANDGTIERLAAIEASTGGRLGVAVLNERGLPLTSYRGDQRFLMCSTFKWLAVAAVLWRVDRGDERLDRRVRYGKSDLLEYAPVTAKNVGAGFMTVGALCAAAIEYSDNTAANLLLATIGGPPGFTRFARSIGDSYTLLERTEPALNRPSRPGDPSDTTTPHAMAGDLRRVTAGDVLRDDSRKRLCAWMIAAKTGAALLRAGVPASWEVGDKTGLGGGVNATGDSDTRNDVAFMRPPNAPMLFVAVYLTGSQVDAVKRDAALASVGRVIGGAVTRA